MKVLLLGFCAMVSTTAFAGEWVDVTNQKTQEMKQCIGDIAGEMRETEVSLTDQKMVRVVANGNYSTRSFDQVGQIFQREFATPNGQLVSVYAMKYSTLIGVGTDSKGSRQGRACALPGEESTCSPWKEIQEVWNGSATAEFKFDINRSPGTQSTYNFSKTDISGSEGALRYSFRPVMSGLEQRFKSCFQTVFGFAP